MPVLINYGACPTLPSAGRGLPVLNEEGNLITDTNPEKGNWTFDSAAVPEIGIIYLISGFGGGVLSLPFIRNNISVGASGALFGLLGAMFLDLLTNWTIYSNKAAALLTLAIIIVINLAIGILPHVDNFAHIEGFLSGFLIGFVFLGWLQFGWMERHYFAPRVRVKSKYKAYQYILWLITVVLLIVG